jgi:uncharacterized protein (DUF4415 family)
MNEKLNDTEKNWVDPDEAPELNDSFFELADEFHGQTLIRRGRPQSEAPKKLVSVRFDADVIAAFKSKGRGWQTRMNEVLKEYIAKH